MSPPTSHLPPRRNRVVVADDDPSIRRIVAQTLRSLGCEVVDVCDGWSLMIELTHDLLRNGEFRDVDLVVTDVRMPGRSGIEIAEMLRRARYRLPFIIMTGDVDDDLRRRAEAVGAPLLDKPFLLDELRSVVTALLPLYWV